MVYLQKQHYYWQEVRHVSRKSEDIHDDRSYSRYRALALEAISIQITNTFWYIEIEMIGVCSIV